MMRKWIAAGCLLLCLLLPRAVLAETGIAPDKAAYALGEPVRLTVTGDREIRACRYTVALDDETVFAQKKDDRHTDVYYLPDRPGVYRADAEITFTDKSKASVSCWFRVLDLPALAAPDSLYSQKDGSWKNVKYGTEEMETSGCAIFTLSNALHFLGLTGEETEPAALASRYGFCLNDGATVNARLIRHAAQDYGFLTQEALVTSQDAVRDLFRDGAVFTFSVARGHIAFACELSEDGTKVRIVDSAPSATMDRIRSSPLYLREEDGSFSTVVDLEVLPGAKYYLTTGQYGGLTYWLDLSYVAKRGVRIIAPYWLTVSTENGDEPAKLSALGTVSSTVILDGQETSVPTGALSWRREAGAPKAAWVTGGKDAEVADSGGAKIGKAARGTLLPLIAEEEDRLLVRFEDRPGYLSKEDAQAVSIPPETYREGILHVKGTVTGKSKVSCRRSPLENSVRIGQWPTGTKVLLLAEQDGYFLAEADGLRGWVSAKNVQTADGEPEAAGEDPETAAEEPADDDSEAASE